LVDVEITYQKHEVQMLMAKRKTLYKKLQGFEEELQKHVTQ
jgi:hypothetical protein